MYHHIAGVDFNHCEKGRCVNCSDEQKGKCEKELDNVGTSKTRLPARRGTKPFQEFKGKAS